MGFVFTDQADAWELLVAYSDIHASFSNRESGKWGGVKAERSGDVEQRERGASHKMVNKV